jgi:hypothetical protein
MLTAHISTVAWLMQVTYGCTFRIHMGHQLNVRFSMQVLAFFFFGSVVRLEFSFVHDAMGIGQLEWLMRTALRPFFIIRYFGSFAVCFQSVYINGPFYKRRWTYQSFWAICDPDVHQILLCPKFWLWYDSMFFFFFFLFGLFEDPSILSFPLQDTLNC